MPNNYFKFKQFIIHQDKTAMKVCTDACLFAAWVTNGIESEKSKIESVLDIGAGTGLLSLMLAQKTGARIEAVEIDEQAALQAKENFEASLWQDRLILYNTPLQQFNPTNTYDLIISNPPFFERSLRSTNEQRNLAKHSCRFSFNDLINVVVKLLKPTGKFCLLLPYTQSKTFETIAKRNQLHLIQKADVQQTALHSFFRTMSIFTTETSFETKYEILSIKDDKNNYTPRFIELLKDYYLNL